MLYACIQALQADCTLCGAFDLSPQFPKVCHSPTLVCSTLQGHQRFVNIMHILKGLFRCVVPVQICFAAGCQLRISVKHPCQCHPLPAAELVLRGSTGSRWAVKIPRHCLDVADQVTELHWLHSFPDLPRSAEECCMVYHWWKYLYICRNGYLLIFGPAQYSFLRICLRILLP